MKEPEFKYFIETIINFFKEVTDQEALCGIPYIRNGSFVVLEYTGIIGISGERKGSIYFTSNKDKLYTLAKIMLNTNSVNNEDLKDLAGEIANIISGNLREIFGSNFMISVPVIVEGKAKDIKFPNHIPAYVFPLNWKNYKSYLVVGLE